MKTTLASASFLMTLVALTAAASAQVPAGFIYGGYYPGGYHHVSTVEEGILQGAAALSAATGQANYYNSLARINNQEARSKYIQNNKAAVEAYFYVREANQS